MFADNLDFLMRLTGTQASALGMACHLNPSHISRLRNGTRPLPKKPAFLSQMGLYFARRVTDDYQRSVLCDLLKIPSWPDESHAAGLIAGWLAGNGATADLTPFLAGFGNVTPGVSAEPTSGVELPKPKSYYYGPRGKQEAVLQFFELILREKAPQTLYLSSNEDMSWLFEDPAFSRVWLQKFTQVIAAGNRIKIIHNIGRDLNEMLEAVSKWIPVYTTGMIEPYYYPRLRDGVLQRTLFIAPNIAAISSVTVSHRSEGRLNLFTTDKDAVLALTGEFEDYLSLCEPLMQIITPPQREALWMAYDALLETEGDVICMSDLPTLITMPRWVAESMQQRVPGSRILPRWRGIHRIARRLRQEGRYVEILPEHFPEAPPQLPCADLLSAPGLSYTQEEWRAHVESARHFSEKNPGYCRTDYQGVPEHICLTVREKRGVIMTKTNSPGVAFAISERNMVDSFWSYLSRLIGR